MNSMIKKLALTTLIAVFSLGVVSVGYACGMHKSKQNTTAEVGKPLQTPIPKDGKKAS